MATRKRSRQTDELFGIPRRISIEGLRLPPRSYWPEIPENFIVAHCLWKTRLFDGYWTLRDQGHYFVKMDKCNGPPRLVYAFKLVGYTRAKGRVDLRRASPNVEARLARNLQEIERQGFLGHAESVRKGTRRPL